MTPYYLAPPLFLALDHGGTTARQALLARRVIAVELTVFAYHFLSPWAWWSPSSWGSTPFWPSATRARPMATP